MIPSENSKSTNELCPRKLFHLNVMAIKPNKIAQIIEGLGSFDINTAEKIK